MYACATLFEHRVEGFGLRYRTGKTVENHTFGCGLILFEFVGKDLYHQVIGYELTFRDVAVGDFAKFCALCYLLAQYIAGGYVVKTVFVYQSGALGAFAATWSAEYYQIYHCLEFN